MKEKHPHLTYPTVSEIQRSLGIGYSHAVQAQEYIKAQSARPVEVYRDPIEKVVRNFLYRDERVGACTDYHLIAKDLVNNIMAVIAEGGGKQK